MSKTEKFIELMKDKAAAAEIATKQSAEEVKEFLITHPACCVEHVLVAIFKSVAYISLSFLTGFQFLTRNAIGAHSLCNPFPVTFEKPNCGTVLTPNKWLKIV